MEQQRILLADDDPEIREVLHLLLTSEGYLVSPAANGAQVLSQLDDSVSLVILDVMMPDMNGYTICTEIRKRSAVPILFLTAKSQDADKALGFSAGGDDYLVKPFSYSELISRIKAMLRRYYVYGAKQVTPCGMIRCCGTVEIDSNQRLVRRGDRTISLTDTEYEILLLLASHPNRVFSVQSIYEQVWREPYFSSSSNTVMVHIRNIRRKLGGDTHVQRTIRTVWGRGYQIE